MKREEELDHLIEMRQQGDGQPADASNEIQARLAAAEMLAQGQEMDVPLEMAERIERRVRTHIQQQTQRSAPARLRFLTRPAARPHHNRRPLKLLLSAALLLLLLCAGTLTAAAHTLPGDPLYGLKQAENQFALFSAQNPSGRADETISQLRSSLNDLATVVTDGRSSEAIQQALNTVITQTQDAQASVTAVPAGSARNSLQQDLANVLVTENQTLRALLGKGNWSIRVAFTQQLGAIGQTVPEIQHVSVSQQKDGTLVVTVTGTNFAPQAKLVINGQPQGIFSQQTATQLVGTMNQSNWRDDTQMVGVLNPDGTATQTQVVFDDHGGQSGPGSGSSTPTSGDDHGNKNGTPSSTPTSGDDRGGSGKG